jgi:hypothetical protein
MRLHDWFEQLSELGAELIGTCEDYFAGRAAQEAVRAALLKGSAHRAKLP